jgi:hypothetical protein
MVRLALVLAALGLIWTSGIVLGSDTGRQVAALSAAQKWLALVDAGKYAESWNEAAELFKNAVSSQQWEQAARVARKPLGNLIDRQFRSSTYQSTLPGAPDGEYVVIQFEASFENKRAAVETVTPMLDQDGAWRVAGYFIR